MFKKLNLIFNILFSLYIISILIEIIPFMQRFNSFGFVDTFFSSTMLDILIVVIICIFLKKKNTNALYFSLGYSFFILITSPIFFDFDEGVLGSIKMVFHYLIRGHYQAFFISFLAWLIPIVASIGIIFYFIDQNKNNTKD